MALWKKSKCKKEFINLAMILWQNLYKYILGVEKPQGRDGEMYNEIKKKLWDYGNEVLMNFIHNCFLEIDFI